MSGRAVGGVLKHTRVRYNNSLSILGDVEALTTFTDIRALQRALEYSLVEVGEVVSVNERPCGSERGDQSMLGKVSNGVQFTSVLVLADQTSLLPLDRPTNERGKLV